MRSTLTTPSLEKVELGQLYILDNGPRSYVVLATDTHDGDDKSFTGVIVWKGSECEESTLGEHSTKFITKSFNEFRGEIILRQ